MLQIQTWKWFDIFHKSNPKPASLKLQTRVSLLQIQTWTEDETEAKARDVIVENNGEPIALVDSFVPYTRNFARVLVFNGAHDGPPSTTVQFVTPEGSECGEGCTIDQGGKSGVVV